MNKKKTTKPTVQVATRSNTPTRATKPKWQEPFLLALSSGVSVVEACEVCQIVPSTVYRRRASDPDFADAWDENQRLAVQAAEQGLIERAEGKHWEYVFFRGEVVMDPDDPTKPYRKPIYDTTAVLALLKARMPAVYKDRQEITASVTPQAVTPEVDLSLLTIEELRTLRALQHKLGAAVPLQLPAAPDAP